MNDQKNTVPRKRWFLFTWSGWLIGVVLVVLLSILMESLSHEVHVQFVVGFGMAIGLGAMQGMALRSSGIAAAKWALATTSAFLLPYLIADLLLLTNDLRAEVVLAAATVLGAALAAVLQARVIPVASFRSVMRWSLAHTTAWALAYAWTMGLLWASNAYKDVLPGWLAVIMAFGSLLTGGPLLALLTHGPVQRLLSAAQDQCRT
ncbi:MAG: hypothetical protein JNL05_10025 [Flavobacteriales bacterium]|nr:hypothetical protein [Flavobacteriales bacterium]